MKTRISQITAATIFALFILVGKVYGNGTEESTLSHENIETALEIENWMVSDSIWNTDDFLLLELEAALEIEIEEVLEIESWMTNDKSFKLGNINVLEMEKEQTLEIESWMTAEKIWNR